MLSKPPSLGPYQFSAIRPIPHLAHQSGADRIFIHVDALFDGVFEAADAMVKRSCLPPKLGILEHSSDSAFPGRDPIIEGDWLLVRFGKEMDMVGHDDVSAYDPTIVAEPRCTKRAVHLRRSQPWFALPGAYVAIELVISIH